MSIDRTERKDCSNGCQRFGYNVGGERSATLYCLDCGACWEANKFMHADGSLRDLGAQTPREGAGPDLPEKITYTFQTEAQALAAFTRFRERPTLVRFVVLPGEDITLDGNLVEIGKEP